MGAILKAERGKTNYALWELVESFYGQKYLPNPWWPVFRLHAEIGRFFERPQGTPPKAAYSAESGHNKGILYWRHVRFQGRKSRFLGEEGVRRKETSQNLCEPACRRVKNMKGFRNRAACLSMESPKKIPGFDFRWRRDSTYQLTYPGIWLQASHVVASSSKMEK